jgi:SAM-dependent methyltransferase
MRHDNGVFRIQSYIDSKPEKREAGPLERLAATLVPDISVNLAGDAMLKRFAAHVEARSHPSVLVLGCGAQRNVLPNLFCDGHDLPFRDETFDGVISCAVLEHVMYPERVVAEVHRVLKPGGVVYSETPFMQQVHEGAYDFTRYSLSGHRRLFNHFGEVHSGMIAGPGTSLAWAIENFALSFTSARPIRLLAKGLVRGLFFWLKYFDYWLADKPQAMDGASCTHFLGVKQNSRVPDEQVIARYVGLNHLRHF